MLKRFLAVPIAFVFNALSRRFLFVEIFVFPCQMVLQFPLQYTETEARLRTLSIGTDDIPART